MQTRFLLRVARRTALFNFLVTGLWSVDVVLAWARPRGRYVAILRAAAFLAFLLAAVFSTLIFARTTMSMLLGSLALMSLVLGVYLRLIERARPAKP